jgi:hypothetical protein
MKRYNPIVLRDAHSGERSASMSTSDTGAYVKYTDQPTPLQVYLRGFVKGTRVVETEKSNCMYSRKGDVYIKEDGCICVMWDNIESDGIGQMGTSITAGTRRLTEVGLEFD